MTFFRLLPRAPMIFSSRPGSALRRLARDRDETLAGQIMPGQRIRVGLDRLRRALGDDLAAMHAGAGADVDDIIGREDRVLVMLDDDHRVAEIAQAAQRIEQPRIVALMQADRGLVEHIEHAGQAGADLRGEPDALALAARQRAGGARQGEIIEPDVAQEGQPVDDLLQNALRDLVALGVELARQRLRPCDRLLDRELADLADMPAVDLDRQRLGLETIAVAGLAGRGRHEALDLLARPFALGLLVASLQIGDDALERLAHLIGAHAVVIGEADLLAFRAVEDRVARLCRQLGPGLVEPELVVLPKRLQRLHVIRRGRLRPGRDGAALQRQLGVGHDQFGIDRQMAAQAAAGGTGAERIVEREQPRLDLRDREARHRDRRISRRTGCARAPCRPPADRRIRRWRARRRVPARSRNYRRAGSR